MVAPADFLALCRSGLADAEASTTCWCFRCVQVVRRLLLKNRDIGLFCNVSGATLTDAEFFRSCSSSSTPIARSPRRWCSSSRRAPFAPWDRSSTRASPRSPSAAFASRWTTSPTCASSRANLTERGFRFVKVPAMLLLNRVGAASTDIHPADFSDLLGALRHRPDRRADRERSDRGRPARLRRALRPGLPVLAAAPGARRSAAGAAREAAKAAHAAPTVAKPEPVNGAPAAPAAAASRPRRPAAATAAGPQPVGDAPVAAVSGALAQFARAGNGRG